MQYAAEQWGERQRDTYAQRLTYGMGKLTRFSHLGEARDDISQGPRARAIEQHAVYYRVEEQATSIIRIPLGKMDAAAELEEVRPA